MKKILNLPFFVILLFAAGCTGPGKIMNGWVGKTKEQLYKTWGQPETVTTNGTQGVILIYSVNEDLYEAPSVYLSNEGDGYTRIERPVQKNKQYTKLKLFYVNPAGIIYAWKMQNI